ncbi:MAG: iron-containing alcohol dehydrogenase [Anaerolineae bacterium]|jgi:alcohol dehydrogenase
MNETSYTFQWPVRTHVGAGLLDRIGPLIPPAEDRRRALIVSAADDWCQRLNQRIARRLRAAGYQAVEIFARVEPNPSWGTVHQGAALFQQHELDTIFAIGGGSTLDAAKVLAMESGGAHVIAVPTTAGTGSELNEWGVITDTRSRDKQSVQAIMPEAAILDPEVTLTLSPRATLLTGIDAFSHALECYVGTTANPITDALALTGMDLVALWLRRAVDHGDDLQARRGMLEASMFGGASMLGAGLGLMHGIGNVAGGLTHDAHGLILARLLEPVLAFNEPAIPTNKLNRIQPFLDTVQALIQDKFGRLNMPEVELEEADLDPLARRAAENVNSTTNPRPFTREDIVRIARRSFRVVPAGSQEGDS